MMTLPHFNPAADDRSSDEDMWGKWGTATEKVKKEAPLPERGAAVYFTKYEDGDPDEHRLLNFV